MNSVRALTVWLGAPILASLLCTAVWQIASGGNLSEWRLVIAISVTAFVFALGGSTILSLAFVAMPTVPVTGRYIVLLTQGAVAGGIWMLLVGNSGAETTAGAVFGAVTAALWVGLHRAVYGRG